jgi:CubicO group peptidase (beta-lactamase class C family)
LKSTTKSFGSIALGLAIKDGLVKLDDPARRHHPTLGTPPKSNERTGWLDKITHLHLASQTAGFKKPGGYTPLLFEPGTKWDYSDSGPNWLAECLTRVWKRDVDAVMFERVFTPLGITRADLKWRKNAYRPAEIDGVARREFGSGIHANVNAMARIGLLMLREGQWRDGRILDREYVRQASRVPSGHERLKVLDPRNYGHASRHYGLLWWNNADETLKGVPTDAYWSWGLYDSLIVVIPSLDVVISRAGKSWPRKKGGEHYDVLKPFLLPVVESVKAGVANSQ